MSSRHRARSLFAVWRGITNYHKVYAQKLLECVFHSLFCSIWIFKSIKQVYDITKTLVETEWKYFLFLKREKREFCDDYEICFLKKKRVDKSPTENVFYWHLFLYLSKTESSYRVGSREWSCGARIDREVECCDDFQEMGTLKFILIYFAISLNPKLSLS